MRPIDKTRDKNSSQVGHSLLPEVVYTPDSTRRQGWRIWITMTRELLNGRELIWRLIIRDVSARYRQSCLGYVWAILPPVATVGIFVVLARSKILPIGDTPLPYAAYALWGISVWQLFAGCLTSSTNSLVGAGSLISKINFSKETLVIASIGHPLFDFLIRLIPVVVVFIWYRVGLTWHVVLMPIILMPAVLLALGIGFVMSIANLVLRDIGNALGMALTFGIFLTPVLYPPPSEWPFSLLNILNPVSPILTASQDLIAYGSLNMPGAFLFSSVFSLLVFLLGWRFFALALPRVAQHA